MRKLILTSLAAMLTLALTPQLLRGGESDQLATAPQPAASSEAPDDEKKPYTIGSKVDVQLKLVDLEGKQHRFFDYRGKLVVVDFWSTQCPWSVGYEEKLKAIHKEYKEKEVVFLAINSNYTELVEGEDPFANIRKYVTKEKIEFEVLIDKNNVVADVFGAKTTPHIYVVDEEGIVQYTGQIDNDPKGTKAEEGKPVQHHLKNALNSLLKGEPVGIQTTKPFGCSIKRRKTS